MCVRWNLNDSTTSLLQNDCIPPKCGELSENTDSAQIEVEDLSSRYLNGLDVFGRRGHDTRRPCCIAYRLKSL